MVVERIYTAALPLFPADFRRRFGMEMRAAFAAAACDRLDMGVVGFVGFLVVEAAGLTLAIGREWAVKLTADPMARFRALPDCQRMRPIGVTRAEWASGLDYGD